MPIALMFTLRPEVAAQVPASLGRATHAAILALIARNNPALAEKLHGCGGTKPLTISNLLGSTARGNTMQVVPNREYGLRVTLLSTELEEIAATWTPDSIGTLELDRMCWNITAISTDTRVNPWAGQSSYEGLAAPALLNTNEGPGRWVIEFAAPVTFRRGGINVPLPTPDLVFGSLLDKWNALAPLSLPESVRSFAAEQLAVSRFDLRSVGEPIKNGAWQIGALGRCTYTALNHDRYWLACIEVLARFAFYAGVGAGTTRGFGRARLIKHEAH